MSRRVACLLVLAGVGCGVPDPGPDMKPGVACLRCHGGGHAQTWSVAGTLYGHPEAAIDAGLDGVSVLVTDAGGRTLTLHTNAAGNFYTAETLTFPLRIQVQKNGIGVAMSTVVPHGDCNLCHSDPPQNSAPGRIFLPQ